MEWDDDNYEIPIFITSQKQKQIDEEQAKQFEIKIIEEVIGNNVLSTIISGDVKTNNNVKKTKTKPKPKNITIPIIDTKPTYEFETDEIEIDESISEYAYLEDTLLDKLG